MYPWMGCLSVADFNYVVVGLSCLQLEKPVKAEGNVEVWLMNLMNMAQRSLHSVIRAAAMAIQDTNFSLLEFLDTFPAQVSPPLPPCPGLLTSTTTRLCCWSSLTHYLPRYPPPTSTTTRLHSSPFCFFFLFFSIVLLCTLLEIWVT